MIKTIIKHKSDGKRITSSIRTITLFGIMIYRKTHYYPDLEEYEIILD